MEIDEKLKNGFTKTIKVNVSKRLSVSDRRKGSVRLTDFIEHTCSFWTRIGLGEPELNHRWRYIQSRACSDPISLDWTFGRLPNHALGSRYFPPDTLRRRPSSNWRCCWRTSRIDLVQMGKCVSYRWPSSIEKDFTCFSVLGTAHTVLSHHQTTRFARRVFTVAVFRFHS